MARSLNFYTTVPMDIEPSGCHGCWYQSLELPAGGDDVCSVITDNLIGV